MAYLIDQMIVYILLAVIVAVLIDIIVVEGRSDAVVIYMVILGAFTGWISYMIFVFATGGLARFDIWMTLPIILTTLVSMAVLIKFADVKVMFRNPRWKVGRYTSLVATLVLVVMLGSFVVLAMYPMDLGENVPTDTRYKCTGRFVSGAEMKISSDLARVSIKEIASPPITIKALRSSVNFPRISENPGEGQYLNFEVHFTVNSGSPTWEQPYCKIWIFMDSNNNGVPDSGEPFVNSLFYKFPISMSGSIHFRNNIAWEGGVALYQVNILNVDGVPTPLPCFHGTPSLWKNDMGQTVQNTPEQYGVPIDMMSWEKSENWFTLKEQVTSFKTRTAGEEFGVDGKMYCPEGSAGNYGIVYQAFDARYTDPFDAGATPLAQKIDLFEITSDGNGNGNGNGGYPGVDITTSSWVTGLVLGGLTLLGSVVAVIKGPKLLLRK